MTWTYCLTGASVCLKCNHTGHLLEGSPEWLQTVRPPMCVHGESECAMRNPPRVAQPDEAQFLAEWKAARGTDYEPYED